MIDHKQSFDVVRGTLRITALTALIFDLWATILITPHALRGFTDFSVFYGAATQLLRHRDVYANVAGAPYIHPAYELLLFLPLALFSRPIAFCLLALANVAVAVWSWRVLQFPWELLALPAVWFVLMTGTDSILLLLCVTAAWLFVQKDRPVTAGMMIGIGMFRFQDLIALVLLLGLWKEWKVLKGTAITTAAASAVSMLIAGPTRYIQVLLSLIHQHSLYAQPIHRMVNLRGILHAQQMPSFEPVLLPILCIVVFGFAAWLGRRSSLQERLSIALLTGCLVSYHCYLQDLVILLIPMSYQIGESKPFSRDAASALIASSILGLMNVEVFMICFAVLGLFIPFISPLDSEYARPFDPGCHGEASA